MVISLSLSRIIESASPAELQSLLDTFPDPSFDGPWRVVRYIFELRGEEIGYCSLEVERGDPSIVWRTFYPLDKAQRFVKHGIGTLCHVEALLHIIEDKNIGEDYGVKHGRVVSGERLLQLEKMGVSAEKRRLDDYLEACIDYAKSKGFYFENPFQANVSLPKGQFMPDPALLPQARGLYW